MFNLLGEYHAKMDAKGRVQLPGALKKQLGEQGLADGFVLNRDVFEKCLVLYPTSAWQKLSAQMGKLNNFVRKNALFLRRFNAGATPVEPDASGRINLPNPLIAYAELSKELVFVANGTKVEIWSKEAYDAMLNEDIDFSSLSEEVMGGLGNGGEDE